MRMLYQIGSMILWFQWLGLEVEVRFDHACHRDSEFFGDDDIEQEVKGAQKLPADANQEDDDQEPGDQEPGNQEDDESSWATPDKVAPGKTSI